MVSTTFTRAGPVYLQKNRQISRLQVVGQNMSRGLTAWIDG